MAANMVRDEEPGAVAPQVAERVIAGARAPVRRRDSAAGPRRPPAAKAVRRQWCGARQPVRLLVDCGPLPPAEGSADSSADGSADG